MRFLFACVIAVFAAQVQAQQACRTDQVHIRTPAGIHVFDVEIADTVPTRARGLMFRESLADDAGMLFVYPTPRRATFWMRNTLIPLDMIFADVRGRVTYVHANAIPGDLTGISGGPRTIAVLEIRGGRAGELGIAEGAILRHPSFAQENAAWPC